MESEITAQPRKRPPMKSATNRAHSRGCDEQDPSTQRLFDSAMDLGAPSLADLAFGLELDDDCFLDDGSVAAGFGETETVDTKAKSKTVLDLPGPGAACALSSSVPSPTDVTSLSFMMASKTLNRRYPADAVVGATPHVYTASCLVSFPQ
mgnify:CR=1 FL=1|jgi:hypothetical protein